MRASRAEIVCGVGIAMLCGGAMRAGAQISDSAARVRAAQMSVCPEVVRSDDGPIQGKRLAVTPFFLMSGTSQLGFGLMVGTPLNGSIGSLAVMSAISMGEGPARFSTDHRMTITIDDSINLAPTTTYDDRSPRAGIHFENIGAHITIDDVGRFAGAKRIHLQVGADSYDFKPGQVQALAALARETQHPTGAAKIETGCVGPSPDALMAEWSSTGRNPNTSGVDRVRAPVYFEFQVEKPASSTGNAYPMYPAVLRAAKVEGKVLTQFVVLEDGSADLDTYKVLYSSNELFSAAAKEVLHRMRFHPAEISGIKVRQLVQLPFEFKLSGGPGAPTDTAAQGSIFLRKQGSSDIILLPRDTAKWTTIAITASDSAHLPGDVYLRSQVDVPVRSPTGTPIASDLPAELASVFSGYAVLEFVVNTDGTVDASTFKVLRATSREVADTFSRGPMGMFFTPAQLRGKKVRQLVVMAEPVMFKNRKQ